MRPPADTAWLCYSDDATSFSWALDGGPQCRLSILRNDNVPCHYFLDFPVNLKKVQCGLSILKRWQWPLSLYSKLSCRF